MFGQQPMGARVDHERRRRPVGTNDKNKMSNQGKPNSCKHCDNFHQGVCKFKNFKCIKCKRIGHIARVCNVDRNFNFVEKDIEVDYLYQTGYANVDRKENIDSHFDVVLEIDNKHHKFTFDSGASISACNKESYVNKFSNYRLHQDNTILRGYNGNTFIPEGYFKAVVKYNGKQHEMKFYVINGGGSNLCGRDFSGKG